MTQAEGLPAGWVVATIDDIATVNPPKPDYSRLEPDAAIGFVPMSAVDAKSGRIAEVKERALSEVRDKSYRIFVSRDILFAKITPCMENGKSAIVPDLPNDIGFGSTEFHVLRPAGEVDPTYLWRFIRQDSYRKDAEAHMTGSVGQMRVPVDFIRSSNVPLPPVSEQRRIVQRLDEIDRHRASVDTHLQVARNGLERLRSAVLAAACSGRLTRDWREKHPEPEPVDVALASGAVSRRKKARGSSEPAVGVRLPELPSSYVLTTVGAAAECLEYGTSARCDAPPDVGIPVLRMGNIQAGRFDLTDLKYHRLDREINRLLLADGDLLFNRTNSPELVGKSAVFYGSEKMSFASYLIRIRLSSQVAKPEFVGYWINSAYGREWARLVKTDGVSQSNINGSKLSSMPLPLPPLDEQVEIVRRVKAILETVGRLAVDIEQIDRQLDRFSGAILSLSLIHI